MEPSQLHTDRQLHSNPAHINHVPYACATARKCADSAYKLRYADTYAAMFVLGYISGPVCRMLSMRTRMQMRVYSGKCGLISGVKCSFHR